MGQIVTTVSALGGGVTAVAGVGMAWRFEVTGTWALNDWVALLLTSRQTAVTERVGYGPASGQSAQFLKTHKRKLYFVGGTSLFFSALDAPTVLNKVNGQGNSFIEMSNEYGFADDLVAIAIFRRQMAVLGRRHIQIWNIDPDPAQNRQDQTLENEGTVNGGSVRGIGRGDVLFCADSGVRSLAKRAASEDAEVEDLGTPIDSLIQAALDAHGSAVMCSIVEPRTSRYWLAIGSTIYVFSYFPSSNVVAWSTYTAGVPVSPGAENYSIVGGGPTYEAFYTVVPGRTYVFQRGPTELSAATCYLSQDLTQLDGADGSFVATGTQAMLQITAESDPGAVTATLQELFVPEKFVVFGGQIFVRSTLGKVYRYGGANNATYDGSVCSWETPWLDARSAGSEKPTRGTDAAMEGAWLVKVGTDSSSANPLREVFRNNGSTFRLGSLPVNMQGTHFKYRGQTTGATAARFAMLLHHFERGNQR